MIGICTSLTSSECEGQFHNDKLFLGGDAEERLWQDPPHCIHCRKRGKENEPAATNHICRIWHNDALMTTSVYTVASCYALDVFIPDLV